MRHVAPLCAWRVHADAVPLRSVREELEQRESRVRAHVKELEEQASRHEDAHAVRHAVGRAERVRRSEIRARRPSSPL